MAKTAAYIQKGEAIDYVNSTEETIPAGTVIIFGKRIGIAGGEIPAGGLGALHMTGVFEIPKKSAVALAAGDENAAIQGIWRHFQVGEGAIESAL